MGWLVYAVPEKDADSLENWMEVVRDSHGRDSFEFEVREPTGMKWKALDVQLILVKYGTSFPQWKRDIIGETCISLLEKADVKSEFVSLCLRLLPSWTASLASGTIRVRT